MPSVKVRNKGARYENDDECGRCTRKSEMGGGCQSHDSDLVGDPYETRDYLTVAKRTSEMPRAVVHMIMIEVKILGAVVSGA